MDIFLDLAFPSFGVHSSAYFLQQEFHVVLENTLLLSQCSIRKGMCESAANTGMADLNACKNTLDQTIEFDTLRIDLTVAAYIFKG